MARKSDAYTVAGVNVNVEAQASHIMYEASKKTFEYRKGLIGEIDISFDDFAGLKTFSIGGFPEGSVASFGLDGAGTKVEVSQRVEDYSTIALDLFAMLTDDCVVRGGEPALIGSVLDVKSFGKDERHLPKIRELAEGYVAAAKAAGVSVINGEIAQMGALISGYGDFPFNWSGACLWFGKKSRLLTGREIRVGMRVVVFRENGPRANGLSLLRKVFAQEYGKEWHNYLLGSTTLGKQVLTPSKIYCKAINHMHGGFEGEPTCNISGVCHITGGGIPEKMARLLRPSGLGAKLVNLFPPPPVLFHCQELSLGQNSRNPISDENAYETWNMGQGMAVVTTEPDRVMKEAAIFGIEAREAGWITPEPGVSIISRGRERPQELLSF